METKELVTLSLAILAFVVSLISTTITIVRGRRERQRAIRNEITNVMSQIVATAMENAKLYHENSGQSTQYYQTVSSILNQRNAFLLHQAAYLTEQVPELVTAVEYNTLAAANANAGDLFTAERFYRKAIEEAGNTAYKSMALRSYAAFLFPLRRFEEGRVIFQRAISLLKSGSNHDRYTNGFTYQMWAWNELHNAESSERAKALFDSAANEYQGIDNDKVSNDALAGLYAALPFAPPPHAVDIQG